LFGKIGFSHAVGLVDIHLVGRIVGKSVSFSWVGAYFIFGPMYAIFVPALARKGSFSYLEALFLVLYSFLHLTDLCNIS
jgi:hypothetical protein